MGLPSPPPLPPFFSYSSSSISFPSSIYVHQCLSEYFLQTFSKNCEFHFFLHTDRQTDRQTDRPTDICTHRRSDPDLKKQVLNPQKGVSDPLNLKTSLVDKMEIKDRLSVSQ